jgi:hypothetical protein
VWNFLIMLLAALVVMLIISGAKDVADRIRDFDDPDKKRRLK